MRPETKAPETCGPLIHISVPLRQVLEEMGLHEIAAAIATQNAARNDA